MSLSRLGLHSRSMLSRSVLAGAALLLLQAGCGGSQPDASAPTPSAASNGAPPSEGPLSEPTKPPRAEGNPFKDMKLWIDPDSLSMLNANKLRKTEPDKAKLLDRIAQQPQALWLGDWNRDVQRYLEAVMAKTKADGAAPIFILYNVPGRDCGQHSKGGLKTADEYRRWVRKAAEGVG